MATMSPPYKPVLRRIVVPPPRPQEDVPPLGVVGAVGEELGLQAHGLAGGVASAALAPPAGVQEVGGVELDPRLLRPGLHHDTGPVPGQPGGQPEPLGGVQNEVVVIAAAAAQLGVIRADVPAQGLFGGEVEGGAGGGRAHGGGDAVIADGGVAPGGQPEGVAHGVAAAVEVEVAVVGDVAEGGLVAGGLVAQGEPPPVQSAGNPQGQRAGKAPLAVGGDVPQGHGALPGLQHAEHPVAEARGPAVELLGPLVGLQRHPPPVDEAGGPGDAVGVPPHSGPQVAAADLVVLHPVEAQHHVHRPARPVRDPEGPQGRAEGDDFRLQPVPAQGQFLHIPPLSVRPEGLSAHSHGGRLLCSRTHAWSCL